MLKEKNLTIRMSNGMVVLYYFDTGRYTPRKEFATKFDLVEALEICASFKDTAYAAYTITFERV